MPDVEIVAAILRRGDDRLLVRQAGPGEEPFWSVPGGRVEPGESPFDALRREVREETGLRVSGPGVLAYESDVHDRVGGNVYAVSAWEIPSWEGEVLPEDPDAFVLEAAWVPAADAVERLARVPWLASLVNYLRAHPTGPGTAEAAPV
jgi:8-oxo-dGTP diphosphatase